MNQAAPERKRPLTWILSLAGLGAVLWGVGSGFSGSLPKGLEPLGGILFVMGLAFLVPWGIKSMGSRLPQGPGVQGSLIQIRGIKAVGQGRTLLVVDVEGERFLLCSGKENLELLARLSAVEQSSSTQQEEKR